MPIARIVPPLVGLLLLSACHDKPEGTFTYGTEGHSSSAPAAPAAPAPAAAAAQPGGIPPSGDAEQHQSPAFYMPSDAELTKTPSGLKYRVIREGSGTPPTKSSMFTAHYCGWFPNGEVFDSSYTSGEPLTYPVNRMIQGWQEALVMMKPGAEYLLVVPPELGYGAGGNGIPPNSTLVFRMELLAVNG
jgi:FKBP-type peptidyl-prolyl cis-trans isomerase